MCFLSAYSFYDRLVGFTPSRLMKRLTEDYFSLVHVSKGAASLELICWRHTPNVARSASWGHDSHPQLYVAYNRNQFTLELLLSTVIHLFYQSLKDIDCHTLVHARKHIYIYAIKKLFRNDIWYDVIYPLKCILVFKDRGLIIICRPPLQINRL